MDEKIKKLKEKVAEWTEKGNKYQEKAEEAFAQAKEFQSKIEELENAKIIEQAQSIEKHGITLAEINKALKNGDLMGLQRKMQEMERAEKERAEKERMANDNNNPNAPVSQNNQTNNEEVVHGEHFQR